MTLPPWSGGFRSLEEEHSYTVAEIDGEVPRTLRGTLFRHRSGRNARRGRFWRRAEGFLGASQDRSRHRRTVQLRHRLWAQDHAHALSYRQGRRDPPAAGHPALSADEPRLRADQEPSGVLPRPDLGPLVTVPARLHQLRRRVAFGGWQSDPDPAGLTRRPRRATLHRDP